MEIIPNSFSANFNLISYADQKSNNKFVDFQLSPAHTNHSPMLIVIIL